MYWYYLGKGIKIYLKKVSEYEINSFLFLDITYI